MPDIRSIDEWIKVICRDIEQLAPSKGICNSRDDWFFIVIRDEAGGFGEPPTLKQIKAMGRRKAARLRVAHDQSVEELRATFHNAVAQLSSDDARETVIRDLTDQLEERFSTIAMWGVGTTPLRRALEIAEARGEDAWDHHGDHGLYLVILWRDR